MSRKLLTRRQVLSTGALSALTLAGCVSDNKTSSNDDENEDTDPDLDQDQEEEEQEEKEQEAQDPPENGAVVFVYDDGPIEDYTQALPAHREFDDPATAGIVSEWVGSDDRWMDTEHLDELVEAGWEICSHTTEHTTVGTAELVENASANDDTLYPEHIRHGHHEDKEIELVHTETDDVISRVVTGLDGEGDSRHITLDEELGEEFPAGSVIRYPEEYMHEALGDSQAALVDMGYEISTLLAPYDVFDEYSMQFVPEYYNGVANANHGEMINYPSEYDPYETNRDYFIEFTTPEQVQSDLDEIAEYGFLGVAGAHTFKDEVTEDRIRDMLSWLNERGIEVLTLREAVDIYT